eukprot:1000565-Rhodomonas_salina.2
MLLCINYAMSGTDLGYAATRSTAYKAWRPLRLKQIITRSGTSLRTRCTMSRTDILCGAIGTPDVRY